MKNNEERKATRYKVRVPVVFESGEGFTRDCSVSGIYFETDRSFSIGQSIEFTLLLEYVNDADSVRVKCLGEIIRLGKNGDKAGVAATIDSCSFEW